MNEGSANPRTISIGDLILNDDFAGIPLNTRKPNVIGFFGEPPLQEDFAGGSTVFRYGSYELSFFDDTPVYPMNDSLAYKNTRHFQNRCIKTDPWIFDRGSPLGKVEIVRHLDKTGARYRDVIWNYREAI